MTEAAEKIEQEGGSLDDLEQEWQEEQARAEAEENEPSPEEKRRAEDMAKKMNSGFLKVVKFTQAPHVDIDQLIDREKGDKAFLPLAEKFGGEMPPWMVALAEKYHPFIAAGMYMGGTIYQARKAEAEVLAYLEREKQQANQEAGQHGEKPES